jgi:hypothetical protein
MEPPGEHDLRRLAGRFADVERLVRSQVAEAVTGDRREALSAALTVLVALPQAGPALATLGAWPPTLGPGAKQRPPDYSRGFVPPAHVPWPASPGDPWLWGVWTMLSIGP